MATSEKYLKEQNRLILALFLIVNIIAMLLVNLWLDWSDIGIASLSMELKPGSLVLGVSIVLVVVASGLIESRDKVRLVYWRWENANPGCEAFTKHARNDERFSLDDLEATLGGPLPTDPVQQNRVWYRAFKGLNSASVDGAHKDWLLTRDITALSFLILLTFGIMSLILLRPFLSSAIYVAALSLQYVVVRAAASNYGVRFVTNVLAEVAIVQRRESPTEDYR